MVATLGDDGVLQDWNRERARACTSRKWPGADLADPTQMGMLAEWGRTPLHYTARDGDLEAINRLLATEDVNAVDNHGWTPLHFAAQDAHPAAIERLLDAGADIHALTEKGIPAIY